MSQKLGLSWKWAPMVHFYEQPNFCSIFECHFSYWISFSDSNLTLLISHCPLPHHSPYPTYPVGIRHCYPCRRAQCYQESPPPTPPPPPPPPDHQLPLQATFCRGAGRPGMMGRNSGHDDNDRDGETATTRRRRRRRQQRWCTQDDSTVAFCVGAGFFSF